MPAARLHLLDQLLAGFITSPEPRALVVACSDLEVLYLVHVLTSIDERSLADRFWIVADPFTGPRAYVDTLAANLGVDPDPSMTPERRLHAQLERLLADLPSGDHRFVCALTPAQIDDPEGFARLAGTLLRPLADPRLRVILRDDRREAPRPTGVFETAAASTSPQLFAYHFSLPHELVTADIEAKADDPDRPPHERAPALLQIASRELGHGQLTAALGRCETVASMPVDPALQALALALKADILRQAHDLEAALEAGSAALEHAIAAGALPVVVHAAMALGDLAEALDHPGDATTFFSLAERAAAFNPDLQLRARARLDVLKERPC